MGLYERFDRFQQRHRFIGFPLAVRQKYSVFPIAEWQDRAV